jgi:hypothetical protein
VVEVIFEEKLPVAARGSTPGMVVARATFSLDSVAGVLAEAVAAELDQE